MMIAAVLLQIMPEVLVEVLHIRRQILPWSQVRMVVILRTLLGRVSHVLGLQILGSGAGGRLGLQIAHPAEVPHPHSQHQRRHIRLPGLVHLEFILHLLYYMVIFVTNYARLFWLGHFMCVVPGFRGELS